MTDRIEEPPIACTLGAGDFKARLDWIAELNRAALRSHLRDDLRLELTYAAEARAQVREMIRREQECCAFLAFDVHNEPGLVRVTIVAPEAAETVFESFQSKAPTSAATTCCGASS